MILRNLNNSKSNKASRQWMKVGLWWVCAEHFCQIDGIDIDRIPNYTVVSQGQDGCIGSKKCLPLSAGIAREISSNENAGTLLSLWNNVAYELIKRELILIGNSQVRVRVMVKASYEISMQSRLCFATDSDKIAHLLTVSCHSFA